MSKDLVTTKNCRVKLLDFEISADNSKGIEGNSI